MAQFDLIMKSFIADWSVSNSDVIAPTSIYYDRAQQPDALAGFPYAEVKITEDIPEVTSYPGTGRLVTYHVEVRVWTAQDMPGSSGDQVTDQGVIMRALESVLSTIPANAAWNFVTGFKHSLEGPSSLLKDEELYLGKDIMISTNRWDMLIGEL